MDDSLPCPFNRTAGQLHIHCGLWVGQHPSRRVQPGTKQLGMECKGGPTANACIWDDLKCSTSPWIWLT